MQRDLSVIDGPDHPAYYDPYEHGDFGERSYEKYDDLPRYDYSTTIDPRDSRYPITPVFSLDPRNPDDIKQHGLTPPDSLRSGYDVVDIYCTPALWNQGILLDGFYAWVTNLYWVHGPGLVVQLFIIDALIDQPDTLRGNIIQRRTNLATNGDNLIGCIFLGNVPVASWQVAESSPLIEYPMDYYYMDLSSVWEDNWNYNKVTKQWIEVPDGEPGDGIWDTQEYGEGAAPYPDIFIGRIDASKVFHRENGAVVSEYDNTVRYLSKINAYYFAEQDMQTTGESLVYLDHDFCRMAFPWDHSQAFPTGVERLFWPFTNREHYLQNAINTPYDFVTFACHSAAHTSFIMDYHGLGKMLSIAPNTDMALSITAWDVTWINPPMPDKHNYVSDNASYGVLFRDTFWQGDVEYFGFDIAKYKDGYKVRVYTGAGARPAISDVLPNIPPTTLITSLHIDMDYCSVTGRILLQFIVNGIPIVPSFGYWETPRIYSRYADFTISRDVILMNRAKGTGYISTSTDVVDLHSYNQYYESFPGYFQQNWVDYNTNWNPDIASLHLSGHKMHMSLAKTGSGTIESVDIWDSAPQALFLNLYSCVSCRFTSGETDATAAMRSCIGNAYIFSEGRTIGVGGPTSSGGIVSSAFYSALASGSNLGEALKQEQIWHIDNSQSNQPRKYLVILGDPMAVPTMQP